MAIRIIRDANASLPLAIEIEQYQFAIGGIGETSGEAVPSPHDLYDAALGACKALTVIWTAKRSGMALERVEVTVVRDNSQERRGRYHLTTEVRLSGRISAAEREEILRVASKCPIQKLMTVVETEITTVAFVT